MRAPLLLTITFCVGCAVDPNAPGAVAQDLFSNLDFNDFACKVQRPLARRCSMLACHGVDGHAFRVYSPGKLRLDPNAMQTLQDRDGPITGAEIHANFSSARGLVWGAASVDDVPLVHKTIPAAFGGGEHVGGVVFRSPVDPDLTAIRNWLSGEKSDPCPLSQLPM